MNTTKEPTPAGLRLLASWMENNHAIVCDEECEIVDALRAYADSLERAPHEPLTGRYYVAHGVEVCEKDSDGDDIVLAACGASIAGRSSTYTTLPRKSNMEMAQRIVDLLNRAAPPPPDVQAWQPIETAPKKGQFLVCVAGLPWPAHADSGHIFSRAHGRVNEKELGRVIKATHWMPLPSPPQAKITG